MLFNGIQYYGVGVNQRGESGTYEGADLMRLLNPGYEEESINNSLYWNRESGTCYNDYNNVTISCDFTSSGLTNEAKEMIDDAKWHTAAVSLTNATTLSMYKQERGNATGRPDTGITVTKITNWIGKVALTYTSDYGYASSECYESEDLYQADENDYRQEKCTSTNWLYNGTHQFQLSPSSELSNSVILARSIADVYYNTVGNRLGVRPTLYLSSSVKITSGSGTINDMYELSL